MAGILPLKSPTLKRHRRQRFWQIIMPISLAIILSIAVGGFTVMAGAAQARLWADVAIIWLIAPMLVFALIGLVKLVALIYVLVQLTKVTPRFTARAQNFATRVEFGTRRVADAAVIPVLWLGQISTAIKSVFKL